MHPEFHPGQYRHAQLCAEAEHQRVLRQLHRPRVQFRLPRFRLLTRLRLA